MKVLLRKMEIRLLCFTSKRDRVFFACIFFIFLHIIVKTLRSVPFCLQKKNRPKIAGKKEPVPFGGHMKKILISTILLTITLSTTSFAFSNNYTWSVLDNIIEASSSLSSSEAPESENNNFLNLEAGSAVLIEQNSGQILYGYNMHERLHPASVTKVMSLLLIMEALDSGKISLETQIPCSTNAASMGGSQIWLDPTESLSVHEMLKAIAVVSANDCVVALR